MASFNFVIDTKGLETKLTRLERQVLPAARVRAINWAAFDARQTAQKLLPLVFDQPTPFTVRSPRYSKATVQSPVGEIFILDQPPPKGTAPATYLQAHVTGGRRAQKRGEAMLARRGVLGRDEGYVPGKAVRLDRFGNIPRGRMTQILSGAGLLEESGSLGNVTARSVKRGPRRSKDPRTRYFVPNPATRNRLPRGVYERYGAGGRRIRPVLLFVKLPNYSRRFDFEGAMRQDITRRMPEAFRRALAYELRRAGIRR